jgi:hypothetical protein
MRVVGHQASGIRKLRVVPLEKRSQSSELVRSGQLSGVG